jgi:hypothetical protein
MAIILLLFQTVSAPASSDQLVDGTRAAYWNNAAIVYAGVIGFELGSPSPACIVELNPIAVLGGTLDPALQGSVRASARIRLRHTVITEYPKTGQKVIVLLERDGDGKFQIPDAIVKFFPKRRGCMPLFEVTGFEDPMVTETIENLRKLRGKQREEAEQKAAAEKNSAEKKNAGSKSTGKDSPPINPPAS